MHGRAKASKSARWRFSRRAPPPATPAQQCGLIYTKHGAPAALCLALRELEAAARSATTTPTPQWPANRWGFDARETLTFLFSGISIDALCMKSRKGEFV